MARSSFRFIKTRNSSTLKSRIFFSFSSYSYARALIPTETARGGVLLLATGGVLSSPAYFVPLFHLLLPFHLSLLPLLSDDEGGEME